jgi:hypothetical protein
MIPLELTILYRNVSYYNRYWTEERNSTAWSVAMAEMTKAGNKLSELMLSNLATQLPGAHVGESKMFCISSSSCILLCSQAYSTPLPYSGTCGPTPEIT